MQLLQTIPAGGAGAGATTFLGLTDTPAAYTGEEAKYARVAAGEAALEFHDLLNVANTWDALQTFSAGIKLAASQYIKDSGGTGRILLATAAPHVTFPGQCAITANAGGNETLLTITPTTTGVTGWRGIYIGPSLTFTGDNRMATGIAGLAQAQGAHGSTGHALYGLWFQANAAAVGITTGFASHYCCWVQPGLYPISGGTLNVTDADGFRTDWNNVTQMFGTALNVTNLRAFHFPGKTLSDGVISITNAYGLHLEDITGTSFTNIRLLELGPATPYLRLLGGGDPNANESNLYLKLGGTLKHVTEGAADSGGSGYRVLRVPN